MRQPAEMACQTLHVVDTLQTRSAAQDPSFREKESAWLIGERPSNTTLAAWSIGTAAGHLAVTHWLREIGHPKLARVWQYVALAHVGYNVGNKHAIDVRIGLPTRCPESCLLWHVPTTLTDVGVSVTRAQGGGWIDRETGEWIPDVRGPLFTCSSLHPHEVAWLSAEHGPASTRWHLCPSWSVKFTGFQQYLDYNEKVNTNIACRNLATLARPRRPRLFRYLVSARPAGATPRELFSSMHVVRATLSFHPRELTDTKQIVLERQGRNRIPRACFGDVTALLACLADYWCGQSCESINATAEQ